MSQIVMFAVKRPIFGDPHTISAQEALIFDVEHHFQLSFGKLVNYVEIILQSLSNCVDTFIVLENYLRFLHGVLIYTSLWKLVENIEKLAFF